jgi:hypothetical protein
MGTSLLKMNEKCNLVIKNDEKLAIVTEIKATI